LRVAVEDRPVKSFKESSKGVCKTLTLCGVSHDQMAKVELEDIFCEVGLPLYGVLGSSHGAAVDVIISSAERPIAGSGWEGG
jgi:hypothetical protein